MKSVQVALAFVALTQAAPVSQKCLSNPQELVFSTLGDGKHFGSLDFTSTSVRLNDPAQTIITTRVHQSSTQPMPGVYTSPTIRMRRGESYEVTLRNMLPPTPNCGNAPCKENVLKLPNQSNLHTHGLHISPAKFGDDVMSHIDGGEQTSYLWNVPCEHSGSTGWYHPHKHGNSVLQVGGGAAGFVIVDDDKVKDGLPSWWGDSNVMDSEALLMVQHMENKYIKGLGATSTPPDQIFDYSGADDIFTINSVFMPEICVTEGKWRRFRMGHVDTHASASLAIIPAPGTTGTCTIQLLAKDGVTVDNAPRQVSGIYLSISGRVDVLVHCPAGLYYLTETVKKVNIATILSSAGTSTTPASLTKFNPIRPSYLKDLRKVILPLGYNRPIVGADGTAVMGVTFSPLNPPLMQLKVDEVQEWEMDEIGFHPLHMHAQHFQMLYNSTVSGIAGWSQEGDWVDVLEEAGIVRFKTARYGGNYMLHCHVLEHEDMGSMGSVYVQGGCDAKLQNMNDGGKPCQEAVCFNGVTNADVNATGGLPMSSTSLLIGGIVLMAVAAISFIAAGVIHFQSTKQTRAAADKMVPPTTTAST